MNILSKNDINLFSITTTTLIADDLQANIISEHVSLVFLIQTIKNT